MSRLASGARSSAAPSSSADASLGGGRCSMQPTPLCNCRLRLFFCCSDCRALCCSSHNEAGLGGGGSSIGSISAKGMYRTSFATSQRTTATSGSISTTMPSAASFVDLPGKATLRPIKSDVRVRAVEDADSAGARAQAAVDDAGGARDAGATGAASSQAEAGCAGADVEGAGGAAAAALTCWPGAWLWTSTAIASGEPVERTREVA